MGNKKIDNLIIHCADTPYGRIVTADDITLWHLGAFYDQINDFYRFLGKIYRTKEKLSKVSLTLPSGKIIRGDQTNGRGWKVPGYSDMLDQDGQLINIVPYNFDDIIDPWEITNGAVGYNHNSRHIVLPGGKTPKANSGKPDKKGLYKIEDLFNNKIIESLLQYILMFKEIYPKINVIGHNEVSTKLCPGFDVQEFLEIYIK